MQEELEEEREKSFSLSPKMNKKVSSESEVTSPVQDGALKRDVMRLEEAVQKLTMEQSKLEDELELARKEADRQGGVAEELRNKLKTEKSGACSSSNTIPR